MATCAHLDTIRVDPPEEVAGCEECLKIGSPWVHLRLCRACGKVGCCDDSPNRHASAHFAESGHPIISSLEPGEDWFWCYEDQLAFEVAT
ncbi:MAG: UBP-type zinc finger domain-containing protein [Candidatus Limnocylindria bacterium]